MKPYPPGCDLKDPNLRRRSRRGLGIRAVDYASLFVAFLSALGIIVAIGLAIKWMVVR